MQSLSANPSAGFDMSHLTLRIDAGYAIQPWVSAAAEAARTKNPPPISAMDISDPAHFVRKDVNFWYMNFDTMEVDEGARTVGIDVTSRVGMKEGESEGWVLSMPMGKAMATSVVVEEMHG